MGLLNYRTHMDKNQATTLIILFVAILLVLLAGPNTARELLESLFWVAVVILTAAVGGLLLRSIFSNWLARSRARTRKKLEGEIEQLCREISTCSAPPLTSEHIPHRLPSKEAPHTFGEQWSRCGPEG